MPPQKHNVLITGAPGYPGGTLLHRLTQSQSTPTSSPDLDLNILLPKSNVFALVRNASQAEAVKSLYGMTPLTFDVYDADVVRDAVLRNKIAVVYFLVDPVGPVAQVNFIKALEEVKLVEGVEEVHFLHSWPVCHIQDNTSLYIALLRGILKGRELSPDYGENGFYLAASRSVVWDDMYGAMVAGLAKQGVIADSTVVRADQTALEKMSTALKGVPAEFVSVFVGGFCKFTAEHGKKLKWKAEFRPEHVLEAADEKFGWILKNL